MLTVKKSLTANEKSGLDGHNEDKNNWINYSVLSFGSGSLFRGQPNDGHLEV
jgi:hypothetical protein